MLLSAAAFIVDRPPPRPRSIRSSLRQCLRASSSTPQPMITQSRTTLRSEEVTAPHAGLIYTITAKTHVSKTWDWPVISLVLHVRS